MSGDVIRDMKNAEILAAQELQGRVYQDFVAEIRYRIEERLKGSDWDSLGSRQRREVLDAVLSLALRIDKSVNETLLVDFVGYAHMARIELLGY